MFAMHRSVATIVLFIIFPAFGSPDTTKWNGYTQLKQLSTSSSSRFNNAPANIFSRRLASGPCEDVHFDPIWDKKDVGRAKGYCKQCIAVVGSSNGNQKCKWCPLTQTCVPARKSAGTVVECINLPSLVGQDDTVTTEQGCDDRPAGWLPWMDSNYGEEWSENKESFMDVIRCSQWALGWPISEDKYMTGKKEITEADVGKWGCNSAQLRAALIRLYENKNIAIDESKTENHEVDNWKTVTVHPKICELIYLKEKATVPCNVDMYGATDFAILRKKETSANTVGPADNSQELLSSIKSGPLVSFSPGAGKSGSGFVRAWDDKTKIKLGVKQETRMNEPENLLQLLQGTETAGSLQQHLKKNPTSLLNRYYGLLRTRIFSLESWTLVMQDASYQQDSRIQKLKKTDKALKYTRYDLKGRSRNLNKKQEPDKQFTLINGDFKENEDDRFKLSSRQCWRLRKAVRADCHFLQEHDMIDYSLFVGVAQHNSQAPDCSGTPDEPFCFQGNGYKYQYTIALIDYLNDFNGWKSAESILNGGKFANYSGKVIDYVESVCPSNESFEDMWDTMVIMFYIGGSVVAIMIILSMFFFCRCKSAKPEEPVTELTSNFVVAPAYSSGEYGSQPSWGFTPQISWASPGGLAPRSQQINQSTSAVSAPISSTGQPSSNMVIYSSMGVQPNAQYQQSSWQPGSFQPRSAY